MALEEKLVEGSINDELRKTFGELMRHTITQNYNQFLNHSFALYHLTAKKSSSSQTMVPNPLYLVKIIEIFNNCFKKI